MQCRQTLPNPFFRLASNELKEVRAKLLQFEAAIESDEPRKSRALKEMQAFDLALQILSDLREVFDHLAVTVDTELTNQIDIPPDKLRLERCRRLFCKEVAAARTPTEKNSVYLFTPENNASK